MTDAMKKIMEKRAARLEMVKKTMAAAGMTAEEIEAADVAKNLHTYFAVAENGREYVWVKEGNREAAMDVKTGKMYDHEAIMRIFDLTEDDYLPDDERTTPVEKTAKPTEEAAEAINAVMQTVNEWDMTADEKALLAAAKNGSEGALCELLAALELQSDDRFGAFYASIAGGVDMEEPKRCPVCGHIVAAARKRGWHNAASAENGRKGGRPKKN